MLTLTCPSCSPALVVRPLPARESAHRPVRDHVEVRPTPNYGRDNPRARSRIWLVSGQEGGAYEPLYAFASFHHISLALASWSLTLLKLAKAYNGSNAPPSCPET